MTGYLWWTPERGLTRTPSPPLRPAAAAKSRRCSKCGLVKPTSDFRHHMDRGIFRPQSYCRACEREFDRVRKAMAAGRWQS